MGLEEIRRIKQEAKLPKQKKKNFIPKKSQKRIQKEVEEKELLKAAENIGEPKGSRAQEEWFKERMKLSYPQCMNCGKIAEWLLNPKYERIWRACQAHILPKREGMFPSVATHPMNHLVLFPSWGGFLCGCHDQFDSSWDNASKMKVWPEAIKKFKMIESSISEQERRKIPNQFLNQVK